MATLRDYQNSASLTYDFPNGTVNNEGQTFTPSEDYVCEQVRFYATWGHSDPGTCRVSIQETTAGVPNGSLLTEWADFSVAGAQAKTLRIVNFSTTPTLSNGTKYAIVWDCPGGNPGAAELIIWGYSPGTNYTGGDRVYYTSSWETSSAQDCHFAIWGSDVVALPEKATNPSPANAATEVDFSTFSLSWDDGGGADTFDVWMGPDGSLVKVSSAQADTSYTSQLSECPIGQKIYWRIDSTNNEGTTTGDTWNFDPRPAQVSVHSPDTDESGWLLNDIQATWESPSANTTSYSVSYGTLSGFLSVVGTTSDLFINLRSSPFPLMGEIYYYRIDAVNQFGTTQGVEIAFTTLIQKLVSPTYYYYPFYYRLLPGGSHPPTGVEDTDYVVIGAPNFISTSRILTAIAMNKFWYEDL
jgi:hypothetical protein